MTSSVAVAVPAAPSSRPSFLAIALAPVGSHENTTVVLVGQRRDQLARADRADLLVGIEQHRDPRVVLPAGVVQDLQRMQDHRDAALVVGDAGAVELVAVEPVRLGRQRVGRIDRVHVRHQHQALLAGAVERALDDRARSLRALDPFGLRAELLQAPLGVVGHLRQAFDVRAAGLDHHHVLQRLDDRRLGAPRRIEQRCIGGGVHRRSGPRQRRREGQQAGVAAASGFKDRDAITFSSLAARPSDHTASRRTERPPTGPGLQSLIDARTASIRPFDLIGPAAPSA